jgi:hypothetical protein
MIRDQKFAQNHAAPNGPRNLISGHYREIGISAVAAALEVTAPKWRNPLPGRRDIPVILLSEVAE